MKTTNMNNTNATNENEMVYILNHVVTREYAGRTEIDITADDCAGKVPSLDVLSGHWLRDISVYNLTTGEESVFGYKAFDKWRNGKTLKELANYRIMRVWDEDHRDYFTSENCVEIQEYYFTTAKRSEIPAEEKNHLWKVEAYNEETGELIALHWSGNSTLALYEIYKKILHWRYEEGIVNCKVLVNGIDVSRHFYANERKRYSISTWRYCDTINITIDTHEYKAKAKGGTSFVCCICGKEHPIEAGTFPTHPVRPDKDINGQPNYCCMACYEKYVGGMRACYSDFHLGKSEIGALSNIDNWLQLDEAILGLSLGEMDYIIEQGRFLTSAMNRLRIEECKDAMRERGKLRSKERARVRARERREETKAAKLATKETK